MAKLNTNSVQKSRDQYYDPGEISHFIKNPSDKTKVTTDKKKP